MRFLHAVAGLGVLLLGLTGCSQASNAPVETMLRMPPSPSPEQISASSAAAPGGPEEISPDSRGTGTAATPDPSEHCVLVAAGMTTAMLAPLGLRSNSGPDELMALEEQILDLRDRVPVDLHHDFTALASAVQAPPQGSGTFDETAFRRAMAPVQDWLGRHCARS